MKSLRSLLTVMVLFVGITAVFSVPGYFRCHSEVDPQGSSQFGTL